VNERRDFKPWQVELVYRAQDGCCARCGRPLQRGFHRHHRDGNPLNNSIDNLELLCSECHYALHAEEKGKNLWEEHKEVQRRVLEKLMTLIDKALNGEISGATTERLLDAMNLALKLSWQEKGFQEDIEQPPPSIVMAYEYERQRQLIHVYFEGFKDGAKYAREKE